MILDFKPVVSTMDFKPVVSTMGFLFRNTAGIVQIRILKNRVLILYCCIIKENTFAHYCFSYDHEGLRLNVKR